jgi:hypothetical protein
MKDGLNLSLAVVNVDISNDKLLELISFGYCANGGRRALSDILGELAHLSLLCNTQLTADPARAIHSGVES